MNFRLAHPLALVALALATATPASAAELVVTSVGDAPDVSSEDGVCSGGPAVGGACTLRAAVEHAHVTPGADRIVLPAGNYQLTAGTGALANYSTVSIDGAGARNTIIRAPAGTRVMTASANLTLRDVTLTGGNLTSNGSIHGGGLLIAAGDVLLERVAVRDNAVASATNTGGGGVAVLGGSLTMLDSTVSGNSAVGQVPGSSGGSAGGGGIYIAAPTTLRRTTVADNVTRSIGAGQFSVGGGVYASDNAILEHVTLAGNASTVVGNSSGFRQGGNLYVIGSGVRSIAGSVLTGGVATSGPNCWVASGALTEPARNLVSNNDCFSVPSLRNTNPLLGPLTNNGGPTDTLRPALASPALDAAVGCGMGQADQRGGVRPAGGACDLGSVELGADRSVTLHASKSGAGAGDDVTLIATVSNAGFDDAPSEALALTLPAGVVATAASSTLGTCTFGSGVTCAIGPLARGQAATVVATIRSTGAPLSVTATRSGQLPDHAALNDIATVTIAGLGAGAPTSPSGESSPGAGTSTGSVGGASGVPLGGAPDHGAAPVVSALKLARRATLRRGGQLTFVLSEAATVRIIVERLLPGRRKGTRCVGTGSGKRCTRTSTLLTRTSTEAAGTRPITVPGKALRAGKVRLTLIATDPAGNPSRPVTLTTTVKRR